jgi:hypothetical protein
MRIYELKRQEVFGVGGGVAEGKCMINNIICSQNHWVYGLRPSSGILNN